MLLIFTFITYTLQVILYVNDTYQYKLTDLFGYLENPTYHAVTPGFNIIPQYYQYSDIKKHNQYADIIISVKAQYNQGYWTNHFLFLENNKGQYNLHYSENLQEENIATPQFNEHLFITKNDQCYDAEQYDQNNYIVDCIQIIDQQPLQNKLYVINKDSTIKIYNVSNPYNYQTIKKRKLNLLKLEQQIYLLQGTLQEIESIIQIYQINQNNITFIEQENEINSKILIILFQLQNTFKFYLIDYKLVYNQIFILDKTFIASLSFDNNGEWTTNLYIPINGNIIAFDYVYYIDENGQQNKILVILKDKTFDLYYNDQQVITYTLIKTISMNSQIKISHQYIIIEDENTIFQYTIKNKILLNQKTLSQVNSYLINPIYPDLISISYNLTRRYFISDGYIQINSQSILQPTNLYIEATSKNQTYYKEIYCQIIDKNDNNLYPNGKQQQIITDVLYKINQTQDIIQFMSGPNIEYVFLKQDQDLDLEFENVQLMNITEFPLPQNIQFQDMLQFNDTLIYHIFQLKDKSIEFYSCQQNTFSLIEQCQLNFKTNNFPINLNSLHFQWWIDQEQAYMIFCSSEYTADLWKLNTQELIKIKAITYLYPITQLLELKGTIYILVESQKKIGVYNSLDGQFLDTIDEKLIKSLGLLKSWSPKRIYGNQKYQSHLLFIKNNDNILITIYNKQINLVECILINEDIQITVAQKSFFIIKVNTTTSLLQEYSIIDLNNIYLIRNLQLYYHEFYNPLQITQSEDNGFLFILTKQKQILLYQPQSDNSNDQLFRIFDVNYTDTIIMSASGYKKTHFYFNNGEQHYYYAFLMQTKVYIQNIDINSLDYYVNTQKTLTVQNSEHSKLYLETINILNTNYPMYLNLQNITLNASKEQILYIFNNNQFQGSIESYQYNNTYYNYSMEFIEPLNKISGNIIQNLIDIEYYNDNYNIAINKDQLFLINNQNNVSSIIDFHQPNSCEFLIVQQNQEYILTLCNYNNKYHIYLIICDQNMKCQIIDTPKDLQDLQGISKIQLISENLLLIQDFGKIYVYYIKRESETWSIVLTQIIDNQRGMTDFIIQSYIEKNYYILSFIDQADYLNIYYTQFYQSKLNIISQDSILIYDVIIKNNQYAFKTTDYVQLFSLQEDISNHQLNYLIIANDVASITLNVQLDSDKKIKETKIKAVFNPYQDWKAINKAYITQNHIFIPYTNKERIILSYYYLNQSQISQNMIQGLNEKAFTVTDGIFTVFSYTNKQNTSKLFCNINKTLDVYEINQYPMLKITNSDIILVNSSQYFQISISNPNKQQRMGFTINFIPLPIPPPDPDDTKKSYWWLITIIIIGSVGIIGGLGYYLWQRRQQKMVRDHYVLN